MPIVTRRFSILRRLHTTTSCCAAAARPTTKVTVALRRVVHSKLAWKRMMMLIKGHCGGGRGRLVTRQNSQRMVYVPRLPPNRSVDSVVYVLNEAIENMSRSDEEACRAGGRGGGGGGGGGGDTSQSPTVSSPQSGLSRESGEAGLRSGLVTVEYRTPTPHNPEYPFSPDDYLQANRPSSTDIRIAHWKNWTTKSLPLSSSSSRGTGRDTVNYADEEEMIHKDQRVLPSIPPRLSSWKHQKGQQDKIKRSSVRIRQVGSGTGSSSSTIRSTESESPKLPAFDFDPITFPSELSFSDGPFPDIPRSGKKDRRKKRAQHGNIKASGPSGDSTTQRVEFSASSSSDITTSSTETKKSSSDMIPKDLWFSGSPFPNFGPKSKLPKNRTSRSPTLAVKRGISPASNILSHGSTSPYDGISKTTDKSLRRKASLRALRRLWSFGPRWASLPSCLKISMPFHRQMSLRTQQALFVSIPQKPQLKLSIPESILKGVPRGDRPAVGRNIEQKVRSPSPILTSTAGYTSNQTLSDQIPVKSQPCLIPRLPSLHLGGKFDVKFPELVPQPLSWRKSETLSSTSRPGQWEYPDTQRQSSQRYAFPALDDQCSTISMVSAFLDELSNWLSETSITEEPSHSAAIPHAGSQMKANASNLDSVPRLPELDFGKEEPLTGVFQEALNFLE